MLLGLDGLEIVYTFMKVIQLEMNSLRNIAVLISSHISKPSICRWDKIYNKNLLLNNLDFLMKRFHWQKEFFITNIPVILDAKKIILLPNFTPYHYRYNPKSIVNTINTKHFVM